MRIKVILGRVITLLEMIGENLNHFANAAVVTGGVYLYQKRFIWASGLNLPFCESSHAVTGAAFESRTRPGKPIAPGCMYVCRAEWKW